MTNMDLILEIKNQEDKTLSLSSGHQVILATPSLDENYWSYRVRLSENQAVLGFPKMMTIGIGFEKEDEDWNTNLPWWAPSEKILGHIIKNKGDSSIRDEDVLTAIKMIREAVYQNLSWADQERAWKLNEKLIEEE
jgi:hypothetical protein